MTSEDSATQPPYTVKVPNHRLAELADRLVGGIASVVTTRPDGRGAHVVEGRITGISDMGHQTILSLRRTMRQRPRPGEPARWIDVADSVAVGHAWRNDPPHPRLDTSIDLPHDRAMAVLDQIEAHPTQPVSSWFCAAGEDRADCA